MCSFAVLLAMRSVLPLLLAPVGALRGLSVGVNGALHVQGQNVLYSLDKNGALLWQFEVSCIDYHWWGTDCLLQQQFQPGAKTANKQTSPKVRTQLGPT